MRGAADPQGRMAGKLLVLAAVLGLEDELMTIAAALTVQSPFTRVDPGSPQAQVQPNPTHLSCSQRNVTYVT